MWYRTGSTAPSTHKHFHDKPLRRTGNGPIPPGKSHRRGNIAISLDIRGVVRGWPAWPKPPPIPSEKKLSGKHNLLYLRHSHCTTFTLHNKLHLELQWMKNALNVSYDATYPPIWHPLALMQLLTDLPPVLQHGDLTF